MRKFSILLLMFVAVITSVTFTSCSKDDDNSSSEPTPKPSSKTGQIFYSVSITEDILYYYDAVITYTNPNTAEVKIDTVKTSSWSQNFTDITLPSLGKAKLTLKAKQNIVYDKLLTGYYDISITGFVIENGETIKMGNVGIQKGIAVNTLSKVEEYVKTNNNKDVFNGTLNVTESSINSGDN